MSAYTDFLSGQKKSAERKSARTAKGKLLNRLEQLSVSGRPTDTMLDSLWSKVIKERDRKVNPVCRICRWRRGTTAYHIVPKQRGHSIRWLLENGVLSCAPCNGGEVWNRSLYRDKHISLFGKDFVERIEAKSRAGQGFPVDRWAVHLILTQELKRLQGTKSANSDDPHKENRDAVRQRREHNEPGPSAMLGSSEAALQKESRQE